MAKAKDNKAGKNAKATKPAKSTVRNRAMNQQTQKRKRGSLKEYFKGVKLEMKKVVWPTKQEMTSYTVVVLVACAAFALAFWAIDSGFLAVLKALLGINMQQRTEGTMVDNEKDMIMEEQAENKLDAENLEGVI